MDSATVLESALAESVTSRGPIVLDLSDLTFLDSSGLEVILKAADMPGRCVILHGVRDLIARIIDISGVNAVENLHTIPCHVAS